MKKIIIATSVLAVLSIVLSACNLQGAAPTQMSPDQINTVAALTVEALTTQMAPPPATATPTLEPPTATPEATATSMVPTLNLTVVPTLPLATNTVAPTGNLCNNVFFVKDENVPDNTVFKPEEKFTKTWTIKNDGTCSWNTLYKAIAFSNSPDDPVIHGDGEYPLKGVVTPGGFLTFTVNLIAPKTEGTYTQFWKMQDAEGKPFGIGPAGNTWWVKIKVDKSGGGGSTAISLATSADSVVPGSVGVGDPFDVDGTVTVSGLKAGASVDVRWYVRVSGVAITCTGYSPDNWLAYSTNGSKAVSATGCRLNSGTASGTHPVEIYTGDPHGPNSKVTFDLTVP